jgi:hypothetical protein
MEAAAREVAELARQAALAGSEPGGVLRLGADELLVRLQRYLDDLLQVRGVWGVGKEKGQVWQLLGSEEELKGGSSSGRVLVHLSV